MKPIIPSKIRKVLAQLAARDPKMLAAIRCRLAQARKRASR